jgi:hypothetical protein
MSNRSAHNFLTQRGENPGDYRFACIEGEVTGKDYSMVQSLAKLTLAGKAMSKGATGVSSQIYAQHSLMGGGYWVFYRGTAIIPKTKSTKRKKK